jgi:hypothetical protein
MSNARRVLLKNSGHACLLETDINLMEILQAQDFLPQTEAEVSACH